MFKDKRSFFERITGSAIYDEDEERNEKVELSVKTAAAEKPAEGNWLAETEEEEGELSVDVYQTDNEIVIQTMIAGVKSEDLIISVTREMITLKGRREKPTDAAPENYFTKELYWGAFGRSIMLPAEVEAEEAEAIEKHGLLTIRLPKIDKERIQKIRVKSI